MTITVQLNDKIINLLREAICKAGSVSKAARELKITNTTIYRVLNKRSGTIRMATVIKIEEYLKK